MSTGYAIAYRLGVTPWEKAGGEATAQFNALLDREQEGHPALGRALDIGCGTGDHAVNLASEDGTSPASTSSPAPWTGRGPRRRKRPSTSGSWGPT